MYDSTRKCFGIQWQPMIDRDSTSQRESSFDSQITEWEKERKWNVKFDPDDYDNSLVYRLVFFFLNKSHDEFPMCNISHIPHNRFSWREACSVIFTSISNYTSTRAEPEFVIPLFRPFSKYYHLRLPLSKVITVPVLNSNSIIRHCQGRMNSSISQEGCMLRITMTQTMRDRVTQKHFYSSCGSSTSKWTFGRTVHSQKGKFRVPEHDRS